MIRLSFSMLLTAVLLVPAAFAADPPIENLKLHDGFKIEVFSSEVVGARSMALGDDGVVYVGTRHSAKGRVYAVVDKDGDFKADEVHIIAEGLTLPNGIEFIDGDLYIAALNKVLCLRDIGEHLTSPPEPEVITDSMPEDSTHGWKYLRQGPDDKLYMNIGNPSDAGLNEDPYASIVRMNLDGSGFEVYARGVRNSLGFDWHPKNGDLYFSDMGRDNLGDNRPACEVNRASEAGQHFGFPFYHAGLVADPDLGKDKNPDDYVKPLQNLGPHASPLGLTFYTGDMFPKRYKNQILVAEHGSGGRTVKIGYRIALIELDKKGNAKNYEPFIDGWVVDQEHWGRPADVMNLPDGSILISDDGAGALYRVTYEK